MRAFLTWAGASAGLLVVSLAAHHVTTDTTRGILVMGGLLLASLAFLWRIWK